MTDATAADRRGVGRRRRRRLRRREPGHRGGRRHRARGVGRAGARRRPRRAGGVPGLVADDARGARRAAPATTADAIKARFDDLLPLVIAETGLHRDGRQADAGAARRGRASSPTRGSRSSRTVIPLPPQEMPATALAPGGLMGAIARRAAGRRRRVHHAVQLPDREHGRQARARARDGQHRRRAAGVAEPARGHRARAASCTRSASRPASSTSSPARRPATGEALVETPRHRHGVVHRFDRRRHAHRRGRRPHDEAPAARARRQGRGARVRRRRREDRGPDDRLGVDVPLRPDLHRADPGDRPARRLRPGRRGPGQDGERVEGRRPVRARHGRRPGHHRRAPRPRRGLHRRPAATKAARSSPAASGPRSPTRGFYVAPTLHRRLPARHEGRAGGDLRPGDRRRCRSTTRTKASRSPTAPTSASTTTCSAPTPTARSASSKRLRAGNVGINTTQRNHNAPFGGTKFSGVGRDGGVFGLHAYSELQSVVWPG